MPYRTPVWRIAVGIVISLLLHGAALVFLRLPEPHSAADPRTWLTEVRIVPRPTPPVPPSAIERAPARTAAAEARRRPPRAEPRKRASKDEAEMPVQPARESTLVSAPAGTGPAQSFDREAAKAAARDIAGDLGPAQVALRETREEKLGRKIQNAARPNCKDGIPGGLLAPLYLMLDKKDSGCKW